MKKRRKLDTAQASSRMRDISKQGHFSHPEPGRSRVELLVGKIKDSMQRKQSAFVRGLSSSSPLPDRSDGAMYPPASPSPKKRVQQELSVPGTRQVQRPNIPGASQSNHNLSADDSSSSEFGDADLDLNFLEVLEMTATQLISEKAALNSEVSNNALALKCTASVGAVTDQLEYEKCISPPRQNIVRHALEQSLPSPKVATPQESDDEFAIEDDTAFATEMRDLAERYDTQETMVSACATGSKAAQAYPFDSAIDGNIPKASVNDSYENDFDDDDDLWNEIGNDKSPPERVACVGSTSQVRAFR